MSNAGVSSSVTDHGDARRRGRARRRLGARAGPRARGRIELRAGDRIRWTRNDAGFGLVNSQTAELAGIKDGRITFRLEDGRTLDMTVGDPQLRHIDRAWASTVHAFQGRNVDRMIAAIEANHTGSGCGITRVLLRTHDASWRRRKEEGAPRSASGVGHHRVAWTVPGRTEAYREASIRTVEPGNGQCRPRARWASPSSRRAGSRSRGRAAPYESHIRDRSASQA